jgi:lysine biosynthesis protein LysW
MARVYCLDCDEKIVLYPHPRLGQKLVCPHCGVDLEVISVDPLELDWVHDWAYEGDGDEEDWWSLDLSLPGVACSRNGRGLSRVR